MSEFKFHAPDEHRENVWVKTIDEYKEMYDRSIEKPDEFWAEMADQFYWEKNGIKSGILTSASPRNLFISSGSRAAKQTYLTTALTGISKTGATRPR